MTPCLLCADAESIPGLQAPRTPAYNHSAVGHVPFIAEEPPLSVADEVRLDKQFNDRWRTLLSVDDLVGAVVGALESTVTLPFTLGSTTKLYPVMSATWVTNARISASFRFSRHVSASCP